MAMDITSSTRLMASNRKKRVIQTAQRREKRGRIYLVVALLIVIIVVGVALYISSLPPTPTTPNFAISAPTGITVYAGQRTTSAVNVTDVNSFNSPVHLSVSVAPSTGLTASISPVNVTGTGTATLAFNAIANGTYSVTVTGSAAGITHSVTPTVATPVYATLQTTNGTIVVELFRAQTPQTVANFVNLANQHFYDGLVWHRIIPGFVIQTGDPNTRNGGGNRNNWGSYAGTSVPFEYDSSLHNAVGYLGMASTAAGAGGSTQFYINVNDNSASLDGKYAVFGRVIGNGMTVANVLANTPTTNQYPNAQNQPVNPLGALLVSVTIS